MGEVIPLPGVRWFDFSYCSYCPFSDSVRRKLNARKKQFTFLGEVTSATTAVDDQSDDVCMYVVWVCTEQK